MFPVRFNLFNFLGTSQMNRGLLLNSSAVPRSIAGCFARQNIGKMARSDGGVKFFKNLFGRFLTIHQEDRNTLIDKRFIAKIQVCLPTNYRLNHSFTHTFTSARFSKQIQRRKLLFQSERTSPYLIVIGKDIHAIFPGI